MLILKRRPRAMKKKCRGTDVSKLIREMEEQVENMELGGDLEALLEAGLDKINRQIVDDVIRLREEKASSKPDFSP